MSDQNLGWTDIMSDQFFFIILRTVLVGWSVSDGKSGISTARGYM